ncbi:hypothetical protein U1Q18_032259 [Sarracenia purpurea var. burkii]
MTIYQLLSPVELAAVGVSIAVFNQVSRIAIFPLVSVTTSFVAEEDTIAASSSEAHESGSIEMSLALNNENKKLIPQSDSMESRYKLESLNSSFDVIQSGSVKRRIPSASSALIIGSILGFIQAIFLILGAKPILNFMGLKSVSAY